MCSINRLYTIDITDALELYYSHGLLATSFVSGLWLEWGLP